MRIVKVKKMDEEKIIIGIVKEKMGKYIVEAEDGTEYTLFAIKPWESVSPDHNTGKFAAFIDKKVQASGSFSGTEIWAASLIEVEKLNEQSDDTVNLKLD